MSDFGVRPLAYTVEDATVAEGEQLVCEFYTDSGTQGISVDTYHTSAGSGTALYKIYALPFTNGATTYPEPAVGSGIVMLASTAGAKDTYGRLVVDPRVAAVTNTHAQTVLPQRIRITVTAGSATLTKVHASVSSIP